MGQCRQLSARRVLGHVPEENGATPIRRRSPGWTMKQPLTSFAELAQGSFATRTPTICCKLDRMEGERNRMDPFAVAVGGEDRPLTEAEWEFLAGLDDDGRRGWMSGVTPIRTEPLGC